MPSINININHLETDQRMCCLLCNGFLNYNQDSSQQDCNYSYSSKQMEEESDCLINVKLEINEESEILGWSEPDRNKKNRYKSKSLHRQLFQFARRQFKVIMNKIDKLQKVPATATALFCQTCERQLCELHDLWLRLTTIRTEFKAMSRQVEKEFQNTYLVRSRPKDSCTSTNAQFATRRSSRLVSRRKRSSNQNITREVSESIELEGQDCQIHEPNHSDEDWIPAPECNLESSDESDVDPLSNRAALKPTWTANADALEDGNGQIEIGTTDAISNTVDLSLVKTEPDADEFVSPKLPPKPKKKRDYTKGGPFPCEYCPKVFAKRENRRLHTRIHTGFKPHVCQHCGKSFYKGANLQAHLLTHSKIKKHVCHICGNNFAFKPSLTRHLAYLHQIFENPFCCNLCPRKFVTPSELKHHVENIHESKKITRATTIQTKRKRAPNFPCDACIGTNFDTCELLKEHHMKEHGIGEGGEGLRICTKCHKTFITEANHNLHTMACQSGKFVCKECPGVFDTRGMLASHVTKEHRCFICQVCGHIFNDGGNLSRHVKNTHEGQRPLKCNVLECGATFFAKVSLKLHMTQHTGQKPIKCDFCEERFTVALRKREHLFQKHPEVYLREKPFYCKHCWMNFPVEAEVQAHLVQMHDKFTCKTCDPPKVFSSKQKLTLHTLVHTGEKPFPCTQCSKTFNKRENLQEHLNRHTGKRPHQCAHCGSGFFRRKELQAHVQKVHSQTDEISKTLIPGI